MQLVHMLVHAQIGTLISLSFQDSVVV
ncbi:hypothetical protein MXB_3438 [Myxobolus squamalis]|nr:hypothetical protein MXB_3438 [Myxobolus squamalis]